jgi:hypothetical protein
MRQVLRLIGNRYGAALVLVFLIVVVVGFGKLLGHGTRTGYQPGAGPPADTTTTAAAVSPGTADDDNNDIEPSQSPLPPPSVSPGAPSAQTVALQFAHAWLHHTGVTSAQWTQGFARYATRSLQEKLSGVDPTGVPASRTTGDPTVVNQESSYVDISIPLDAGTLSLRLVLTNGRWLVDGVDWQRS